GAAGPGSVFPAGARLIKITAGFVGPEHPHCLQIGVDDGGTHEFHAALLQILRDRVRQRRGCAANFPQGPAFGPVPEIAVETAPLPPDGRKDGGVAHRCGDLAPVAHNACIRRQGLPLFGAVGGHLLPVEAVEGAAEIFPFVEDALPGKPGLEPFQDQHFKQRAVVVHRHAPFPVVVMQVTGVFGVGPAAARAAVLPFHPERPLYTSTSLMSRLSPPVAEWMNSTASSELQSSAGILISMPDSVLKLRLSIRRMRAGLTVTRSSSRTPVSARACSNFGAASG